MVNASIFCDREPYLRAGGNFAWVTSRTFLLSMLVHQVLVEETEDFSPMPVIEDSGSNELSIHLPKQDDDDACQDSDEEKDKVKESFTSEIVAGRRESVRELLLIQSSWTSSRY